MKLHVFLLSSCLLSSVISSSVAILKAQNHAIRLIDVSTQSITTNVWYIVSYIL